MRKKSLKLVIIDKWMRKKIPLLCTIGFLEYLPFLEFDFWHFVIFLTADFTHRTRFIPHLFSCTSFLLSVLCPHVLPNIILHASVPPSFTSFSFFLSEVQTAPGDYELLTQLLQTIREMFLSVHALCSPAVNFACSLLLSRQRTGGSTKWLSTTR